MHISVFMGPIAMNEAQDLPQIELCIDQSIRAAEAGIAMVTFGEQHFGGSEPYSNPFMMGSRLAPHLGRTWFGTTIVPLPFHNPLRLAEESNLLDLLTRGRFLLGMSAGRVGMAPDFKIFDVDPEDRVDSFMSKLDYLERARLVKAGDAPLIMDSKWDSGGLFGRMMPVSWRRGGAQLAIGSNTPAMIAAAAERGLPVFLGPTPKDKAAELFARHRDLMAEAGLSAAVQADAARKSLVTRQVFVGTTEEDGWATAEAMAGRMPMMNRVDDHRSFQEMARVPVEAVEDGSEQFPANVNFLRSWVTAGGPDDVVRDILAYRDLGVQQLNVRFNTGMFHKDLVEKSFRLFVDEVLPNIGNELFPDLVDDELEPVHLGRTREGGLLADATDPAYVAPSGAAPMRERIRVAGAPTVDPSGAWKLEIRTPMGVSKYDLDLAADGGEVTGTATDHSGSLEVRSGVVDGDELSFVVEAKLPFPMSIRFSLEVDGDAMSGTSQAGVFPPAPATAKRAVLVG
ncbi:LLM class flavin-dependent oxidoreductase [uncultured Amnibacterium sp.]|uniref:LLM class flavin-dependent oxidoreductase n=1 Tax=uncultured Amnibacterium sp. TaxID=1631851 RepID=UPI0035CB2D21